MDNPDVVVDALGIAVGIPVTGPAVDRLRTQWARALTDRPADRVIDITFPDPEDEHAFDYSVSSRVTLAALEATAGVRLNLHAGTVADTEGRALALVGQSGSGKTTAVSTIARRLGYLSDETTSVDTEQRIAPHPKPLSVITDRDHPDRKESIAPDALGLAVPPSSATLRRLVLLDRGEEQVGLEVTPAAMAIATLVPQTSSLATFDDPIRRLADLIDACGGVWTLRYAEFEPWVEDLVALLDAKDQPKPDRWHHPGPVQASTDPMIADPLPSADEESDETPTGTWSRVPWRDAVEYEDALVLMVRNQVDVLSGLGVLLWLALEEPKTAEQLLDVVECEWGPHPDAAALIDDALTVLRGEGLLRGPA